MNSIAAFDIGGTYIKYGLFSHEFIERGKVKTPLENNREEIPKIIIDLVKKWSIDVEIDIVGISTAGNIDKKEGSIIYASNIRDYTGCQLKKILEDELKIEVFLENDVNAATYGEYYFGAGRDYRNFFCMTLGTGIGGSFFINGELYEGSHGLAGEIGHTIIDLSGRQCSCGNKGCLGEYASTRSLCQSYYERGGIRKNGKEILAALDSDPKSLQVFKEFLEVLAIGLANIGHLMDPEAIIIGGGISEAGDVFFQPLREEFELRLMESYRNKIEIKKAELGNDAGLMGIIHRGQNIIEER